jgi:hypothetical protein
MDHFAAILVDADGMERVIVGSYVQLTDRIRSWGPDSKPGSLTQATFVLVRNLPPDITIDEDLR